MSDLAYIHAGWLHFHTQNMAFYFLPFLPKMTVLQHCNTYMVTSPGKQSEIQISNTSFNWVET